jgi:hypothetical protein
MRVIRDAVAGSDYRELPGNSARRRASDQDTPRSECFRRRHAEARLGETDLKA